MAKIGEAANSIAKLAPDLPNWFPAGSGPDAVKTEAKANIWEQPEEFKAAAEKLISASANFAAAASAGDVEGTKAQIMSLGGACKNCHDQFREEEE